MRNCLDRAPILTLNVTRGCFVASRLANYFSERFVAYAYFTLPFMVPDPTATLETVVEYMTKQLGYDPYGYWWFMDEDDAYKVFADHVNRLTIVMACRS